MILQLDLIDLSLLALLGTAALAALALLLADAERLPPLARAGVARVLGEAELQELLDLQRAWERRMLSPFQFKALQVIGATLGLMPMVVLIFARQNVGLAVLLGLAASAAGAAYPGLRFQRGLVRKDVRAAEKDALGFVARLRHELTMGTPLEGAIRSYVETEASALADLMRGVPMSAGADPVAGVREIIRRTESPVLMPIAASLGALEHTRDPEMVLLNMQERTRLTLVAQMREANAAIQLRLLAEVVALMLIAMLLLVFGATIIRVMTAGVF